MLDHLAGRPSPTWKRGQVFLVLFFWAWRLSLGDGRAKDRKRSRNKVIGGAVGEGMIGRAYGLSDKLRYRGGIFGIMGLINKRLRMFSPYQLIVGTLTMMYALRNLDVMLGLGSPEPLANLYSPAYYRASYIATAFDAGFATAMTIRPTWLKDICSVLFTGYYLIWAREADEKLRRYRALCTVEMLRVTWEKTTNPYIRALTYFDRPRLPLVKTLHVRRPSQSKHTKPISAMLFYAGSEEELAQCSELILDFPGGGFVAMGPECHEERLRRWAKRTGKVILSVDYGKAPEYPYPWAIQEGFDVYRTIVHTQGSVIGMLGADLRVVLTGDSAGGNIVTTIMLNILESTEPVQAPVALVLAYPALDFNFTSWMTPQNLKVLRTEQSTNHIPGFIEGKDHMRHKSPLSVVNDVAPKSPRLGRIASWRSSLNGRLRTRSSGQSPEMVQSASSGRELPDDRQDHEKSIAERVKTPSEEITFSQIQVDMARAAKAASAVGSDELPQVGGIGIGTRLTMTSRTGYFQDRIISPSMMRAMAILYIGPKHNPDFQTDYYISPILAPDHLLARFPPVYLISGEKDPFVDDTVIFAGRIREAKRLRKAEAKRLSLARMPKFRNDLRMSRASTEPEIPDDPILAEEEEDWVQSRIIEGWGHGFMQMLSVMSEAEPVILDVADWIDEAFERYADRQDVDLRDAGSVSEGGELVSRVPSRHNLPKSFSLVKAATTYKPFTGSRSIGTADLGAPVGEAFEQDEPEGDGILEFTTRKRRESNSGSNSSRNSGVLAVRPSDSMFGFDSPRGLPRNSSAPRFNISSELLAPHGTILPSSLTSDAAFRSDNRMPSYRTPRASFAMFGQKTAEGPRVLPRMHPAAKAKANTPARHGSPSRVSGQAGDGSSSKGDSASRNTGLTEAELLRRRRLDAVGAYGMGDGSSAATGDGEEADERERRFRW